MAKLTVSLGVGLVRLYQLCVSPFFPSHCRFVPTCSQFAIDSIRKYGLFTGILKTAHRVSRCHPFHPGGIDPA